TRLPMTLFIAAPMGWTLAGRQIREGPRAAQPGGTRCTARAASGTGAGLRDPAHATLRRPRASSAPGAAGPAADASRAVEPSLAPTDLEDRMGPETRTQPPDAPVAALDRKRVGAWALFDFANRVFPAVMTTAVFPVYSITVVVGEAAGPGGGEWGGGRAVAVSALLV